MNNKKVRYEPYAFITRCQKENIISDGLQVCLEPSISNHSEEFLNNWHERLQSFSLTLMSDVLKFCKKITETVLLEIKETQKELKNKLENEEREEITVTLGKNDKTNRKQLQQRKNKKSTYLKFKPTRPITKTTEFKHGSQFQRKTDNPGEKQTNTSILHKQSNTNIQRKLNKKNIAKTNVSIA